MSTGRFSAQSSLNGPSQSERLSALQTKLHSAKCEIIFLQNQHRATLRGLHDEISRLQKTVRELQFALATEGLSLFDEESYKGRIARLEEELERRTCHCKYLSSQLEQANGALVSLNQRLQLQDWQHQTEIAEKEAIIVKLQHALEMSRRDTQSAPAHSVRSTPTPTHPYNPHHGMLQRRATSQEQAASSASTSDLPTTTAKSPPLLKRAHSDVNRLPSVACLVNPSPSPTPPRTPQTSRKSHSPIRLPPIVSKVLLPHYKRQHILKFQRSTETNGTVGSQAQSPVHQLLPSKPVPLRVTNK